MNIFDFIKSQIAILDLIQEYTTLKRAGVYWKGLCPFHGEKTGSFTVSPHRQIFYCFGCHASGDAIGFIAKIENLSQIEAAKFIADRYNLTLPENIQVESSQANANTKEHYFGLCQIVAKWCQQNLKESELAQGYLSSRQITQTIIEQFSIGYFPKGQAALQNLIKFVQKNGLLASDLIEANILQKNQHEGYFSGFEDRIIFPIQDLLGRFCAFGGRVFKPGDERVKYYNSHEHQFFNKRATLFGLNLAKKKIQTTHTIHLVEGYMDCIAMHQAGFVNTVATLGTACTTEHIDIIARLAEQVCILYDGDKAGIQAVERLAGLCWNANLEIKVVELPKGEDPASILAKQIDLGQLIKAAGDIYHFVITKFSIQYANQNLSQKFDASAKISEMINKVSDPLKRNILLQHAAQSLGIATNAFKATQSTPQTNPQNKSPNSGEQTLTEQVLTIFINHPEQFTPKYHYLTSYLNQPSRTILQKLLALKERAGNFDTTILMTELNEEEQGFVRKCLLTYNDMIANETDQILDRFHKQHWKQIVGHIKTLLTQEGADRDKVKQIIENFQTLKSEIVNGGQINHGS